MIIKVSEYLSNFFVNNGITDCFMVTGGGAMHLDDAIGHQKGMHCVFNHHEQACAIAAEAYARSTGRIALVCVTSGPGGTNAITGVVGGWLDSIPMFVVSGQVKRETTIWSCPEIGLRQLGDQEFNIVDSVRNMTKYSIMITNPNEIAYHLEKALFLALIGRPGPVWLDIPLDVQGARIETDDLVHFNAEKEFSNTKKSLIDTKTILDRISKAKAPLLLVGTGVRVGDAKDEVLKLIDKLKIPVVTAWNANDIVAFDNPYFSGMPGTVGTRPGNFAVQNCDLLLSLGCRLNIRMIGYNHFDFAKNAYKIVVDIDEKELRKPTIKPDMPICSDVKDFIKAILKEKYTPNVEHERWVNWCKEKLVRYPSVLAKYHDPLNKKLNHYVFTEMLFDRLKEDDRIVCGNGAACVVTFQACKIKQGQQLFTNSGCAAMGYGLPASLGVAVSNNSKRTICIDGDGSIMMNIQELATIKQNNLNIKLFIINNNGYLSIRQTQRNLFKPPFIGIDKDSGVGFPSFEKLSEAFGLSYFKIANEKDCNDKITEILSSKGPTMCEVVVDSSQNFEPKSSSKVLPDGKIISPSLDDMAPFLPRDEYNSNRYNYEE